jgi:hypothetical protein
MSLLSDTTERGDRGSKEAQKQGERRVTELYYTSSKREAKLPSVMPRGFTYGL